VEHFLSNWGYLALFVATLVSTLGIPIGSELAIIYAGALASGALLTTSHDHLHLIFVILVALAGETVGSSLGYAVGYIGGRPLVHRLGRFVLLSTTDLDRAERFFSRHGDGAVFFTRFIPLVRSFVSLAAGLTKMRPRQFLAFSIPACAIWCVFLASVGDALGHSWHHLEHVISFIGYIALAIAVIVIVGGFAHRIQTVRRERRTVASGGRAH
jgi:membrane protein DedA with SNARE-associated domain